MILFEENTREEQILCVAKAMMTAIRTAPKAKGVDNIETGVISGITVRRLAARMRDIGKEQGLSFFLRDAENIENSACVVLVGAKQIDQKLNCGQCGYPTCQERENTHPTTPCSFIFINQGIAVGSAVSVAADNRVDC
ncbi:MAG: ferredoxin, partial [Rikenellaceae bacterium]